MVHALAVNMTSLMDIKIFGHSLHTGTNACSKPNNCTYICVGAPQNKYTCLCPDGMSMSTNGECLCPNSIAPYANKTCPQMASTCAQGFFTCAKKLCIPNIYRCDGENDCGDGSELIYPNFFLVFGQLSNYILFILNSFNVICFKIKFQFYPNLFSRAIIFAVKKKLLKFY